ncbi:zinc carboxypeptidase-like [Gigantopelta aegis]|uniref:zinc carboxypeptidase-like n=1 Tax=Gigantopelta aegis TaxID=1735272 RepID=UPI001B8899F1|nr:zinc carboxypeptidase-like [Gigantopelta aegis]XP_041352000.1 zinc carboxypeptidase-like [Gigantopelta aegis]
MKLRYFHQCKIFNCFYATLSSHILVLVLLLYSGHGVDVKPQKEPYLPDYEVYHNLSTLNIFIQNMAASFPNFVKVDWTYKSLQHRSQYLLHVTNFSSSKNYFIHDGMEVRKIQILFSYGEHAREFFPVESLIFLLKNITQGASALSESFQYKFSKFILTNFDLYIIVMANPDGRFYVEMSDNYCWRGTSKGVDINRNFGWEFGKKGSSSDPNDEEYRGPSSFSEPETKVFTTITERNNFDVFISFHSGTRQIYLPFADTRSKLTHRIPDNLITLTKLASALSVSTAHKYQFGRTSELTDYTADGTSFDYMAGVKHIPLTLAIELWGRNNHVGPSCFDQFNPQSEQLQREISDIHPLYVTFFQFTLKWKTSSVIKHQVQSLSSFIQVHYLLTGCLLIGIIVLLVQGRLLFCHRLYSRKHIISLRSLSSTLTYWGFIKSV